MLVKLKRLLHNTCGATAIEYAMIAAFIAVIIVTVVGLTGTNLAARFQAVLDAFS